MTVADEAEQNDRDTAVSRTINASQAPGSAPPGADEEDSKIEGEGMGRTPSSNLAEDRRGGDLKQVGKRMLCKAREWWATAKHEAGGGAQVRWVGGRNSEVDACSRNSSTTEVVEPDKRNLEDPGKAQMRAMSCDKNDACDRGVQDNSSCSSARRGKVESFDPTLGYPGQDLAKPNSH